MTAPGEREKMVKVILTIDGMSCGMCEAHMNDAVRSSFSVKKVRSSHRKGTTEFLTDETPSKEALHKAIDPTGYTLKGYRTETVEKKHLFW